tara:strand:+ start:2937 stop:3914 length:978 start_codon:yes stop_codon:yes gene_type:complete
MKIVNSITQIYSSQYKVNEKLKIQVDALILAIKEHKWHYVSRIKQIESFAQKLETNRVEDPTKLEDFFACTVVVENTKALKKVKGILKKHFKIEYIRPKNDSFTHKDSSSFVFDDIRLYVKLKPTTARVKGPINNIVFEIQIKTFLQHAWSIATHDLMYKSDKISWTKQRVAYQVKAILENAEVSIEKASTLKRLPGIPNNNQKVQFQNDIKEFVLKCFSKAKLPSDLVRLINSIEHLMKVLFMALEDIEYCLIEDTKSGAGVKTLNLSPYLIILQAIINQNPKKIISFMKRKPRGKRIPRIFLPSEIDTSKIATSLNIDKIIVI